MPASNIQRIEVITVPPSKYDAEGLAGLINIVLKKPIGPGYNASINLRENTITGPVGGVSITSKAGKLGITYNAGYSDQIKRDGSSVNTLQTFNPSNTFLDQIAKNTNQGHNIYSGLELSYEIDTLNLVTGNFNYTRGQNSFNNRQTSQLFDVANSLIQNYNLNSNSNSNYHGIDFGINYQLGFKKSKDQLLTFSYQYTTGPHSSLNDLQFFDRYNFTTPDYDQNNESGTKENTIQIDYQQPLKHVSMEAGIKAILRNNYSNFNTEQLDSLSHNYVNDPTSSNDFTYHQDVYSAYNSYQFNYGTWGLKAGVRAERTDIDANFITSQTLLQQGYTNFIPSINILKSLKNNINLNFGFTNRIERPNIYELNPFVDESNPKFVSTGNPDLRPVLNHTLELGFSKYGKGSLNLTVSYAFANNTIQNVTNLRDSVSYTTYQNVGSDKLLGLNMSFNYPLFKGCNFGINGEVDYVTLKGYFNQSLYENSGFQGFGFANLGYQVNDTWRVGLNGAIYSANILLQGKSNPYYFSSINTTKDIFKKKVTVFFYVNNITQKYKTSKSYASDPAFYETNLSENLYRTIGFGFYYHFGKFNRDIKKNRTGINNDDLSNHKKSDNN